MSPPAASDYRERAPAARLGPWAVCAWVREAAAGTGVPEPVRVVPDACVDLMWIGGALLVAGPDTRARLVALRPGDRVSGVRLRPGAAALLLGGTPACEIRDEQPALTDLWGPAEGLADRVAAAGGPWAAAAVLERELAARTPAFTPDRAVMRVVAALDRPRPPSVAALAGHLGLSERHLRRRVTAAVGYGPKTLEAILRFRRAAAVRSARPGRTWADVAAEAGYADQAHLARETRRWSGLTPSRLLPGPPTAR